jgi:hypothetical protein
MFTTKTLFLALFLFTVHGELVYQTPDSSSDHLQKLMYIVLTGVLMDWLRMKFMPPLETEKLGSAVEKLPTVSEEETEQVANQTSFDPSKQIIEEKQTQRNDSLDEKIETILKEETVQNFSIEKEAIDIQLETSNLVNTVNVEPEDNQENGVIPFEEIEEIFSNLNKQRPRFYSDPTGREDRWGVFAPESEDVPKLPVGERTPETTPEMSPPTTLCKPEEIPALTEPGSTQEVSQQWLLPEEEKINERKPMVFIGGVSASTTPMEVVYELKQQGFNVTVVPRIRYGVSFGFCPDLVLSSEGEVEALLAMKKIWIKDRWIDVRPYVPKEEELAADAGSQPSNEQVTTENTEDPVHESTQEVNENVFAETHDIAITPPGSESSTPKLVSPPDTPGELRHFPTFTGYDCAYIPDMNVTPPGSMASTPTYIPTHAIPTPLMFPLPPGCVFTPQFPEYVYHQEMPQSIAYEQEMVAVPANY